MNRVTLQTWVGIFGWSVISTVVGMLNVFVSTYVVNQSTVANKADEAFISMVAQWALVAWAFFTGFLFYICGNKWKDAEDAKSEKEYRIAADKRLEIYYWIVYVVLSVGALVVMHLYHVESPTVQAIGHFLLAFVPTLIYLIVKDFDDPTSGVIKLDTFRLRISQWTDETE